MSDLCFGELLAEIKSNFELDDEGNVGARQDEFWCPSEWLWDDPVVTSLERMDLPDPPYLDRVFEKRRPSPLDGLEYHIDEMKHRLLNRQEQSHLGDLISEGQEAAERLHMRPNGVALRRQLGWAVRHADEAREELALLNLRLVFSIARRFRLALDRTSLGLEDLIQYGYLGLLRAVEKYDPDRGAFSTYATWWIRQSIQRGLADHGRTVRIPLHLHDQLAAYRRTKRDHEGDEQVSEKIAVAAGVTSAAVAAALRVDTLDPLHLIDEEIDMAAQIQRAEPYTLDIEAEEVRRGVLLALSKLDAREREIMELRYGLDGLGPRTLDEIGIHLGLTRERIRQLEKKVLARLLDDPSIVESWTEWVPPEPRWSLAKRVLSPSQEAAWERLRQRASQMPRRVQ